METEKRLIDAYALMEETVWKCGGDPYDQYYMGYQDALDNVEVTIENQPTVDAVEVIRCKNCKWYDRDEFIMPQSGSCEFHETVKMDWDFCSRGKLDGDGNG